MSNEKEFTSTDINEIKRWANKHISAILRALGIRYLDRGRYITGCCPIPYHAGDGDNPRAWVWAYDQEKWRCYSHSCQEETGSDVIGLVMAMKEVAFPIAIKILQELKDTDLKDVPAEERAERILQKAEDNKLVPKDNLKILHPDTYFRGRGISEEVLAKHKVGYWQKTGTFMDRRAVVPIFDYDNNLVGFTGRVIIDEEERAQSDLAKWVHGRDFVTRKAGLFRKTSILYNLNNCKQAVLRTHKVYLVEGPIDLWKMEMAGVNNVVATLGLSISFEQIQLLVRAGVSDVVICYDNDDAGNEAAEKVKAQLDEHFEVSIKHPTDKDFGEMSTADILETLF
jgi:DNA primase